MNQHLSLAMGMVVGLILVWKKSYSHVEKVVHPCRVFDLLQ